MNIRSALAAALLGGSLLSHAAAHAALINVDFTINGGTQLASDTPFGMTTPPSLSGSFTADSSGGGTLIDFLLVTGSRTWTENDLNVRRDFVFAGDTLVAFYFESFIPSVAQLGISYPNTFQVSEFTSSGRLTNVCNDCVSISQVVAPTVSEPATLALLGLGLALFAASRRRSH